MFFLLYIYSYVFFFKKNVFSFFTYDFKGGIHSPLSTFFNNIIISLVNNNSK
jgi:hypothetical protein